MTNKKIKKSVLLRDYTFPGRKTKRERPSDRKHETSVPFSPPLNLPSPSPSRLYVHQFACLFASRMRPLWCLGQCLFVTLLLILLRVFSFLATFFLLIVFFCFVWNWFYSRRDSYFTCMFFFMSFCYLKFVIAVAVIIIIIIFIIIVIIIITIIIIIDYYYHYR